MKEPSDGDKPADAGARDEQTAGTGAASTHEVHFENASAEKPGRFWRRVLPVENADQLADQALGGASLSDLQASLSGESGAVSSEVEAAPSVDGPTDAVGDDDSGAVFLLAGHEVEDQGKEPSARPLEEPYASGSEDKIEAELEIDSDIELGADIDVSVDEAWTLEASMRLPDEADEAEAQLASAEGAQAVSERSDSAERQSAESSREEQTADLKPVVGVVADAAFREEVQSDVTSIDGDGEDRVGSELPQVLYADDVAGEASGSERSEQLDRSNLGLPSRSDPLAAGNDGAPDGDDVEPGLTPAPADLDVESLPEGEAQAAATPEAIAIGEVASEEPAAEEAPADGNATEEGAVEQKARTAIVSAESSSDDPALGAVEAAVPGDLERAAEHAAQELSSPELIPEDLTSEDFSSEDLTPDEPASDERETESADAECLSGSIGDIVRGAVATVDADDLAARATEMVDDENSTVAGARPERERETQTAEHVGAQTESDDDRPVIPVGLSGGGATRPPRPTPDQAAVPATLVKAMMGVRGHRTLGDDQAAAPEAVGDEDPVSRRRVLVADDETVNAGATKADEVDDRAFIESNSIGALFIGARVTKGLHDLKAVEREIRIKAPYLEAIEAIEPDGMPKEAYIPGYVKTYARYLQSELPLGPEEAYEKFRKELNAKLERLGRQKLAPPRELTPGSSDRAGAVRVKRMPAPSASERIAAEAARQRSEMQAAGPVEGRALDPMGALKKAAARSGAGSLAKDPVATRRAAGDIAGKIARARAKAKRGALEGAAAQEPWLTRYAPLVAMVAAIGLAGGIGFGLWRVLEDAQRVSPSANVESKALRVVERRNDSPETAAVERPSAAAYADGTAMTTLFEGADEDGAAVSPSGAEALPLPNVQEQTEGASEAAAQQPVAEEQPTAAAPSPSPPAEPAVSPRPPEPRPDPPPAVAEAPTRSLERDREQRRATGPAFGIYAIEDTWLRVRDRRGRELLSGILAAGATAALPADRGALEIRAGNAGGVAFVVNGSRYGPVGASGAVEQLWIGPARIPEQYPAWSRSGG